jgi:hypothetical protein
MSALFKCAIVLASGFAVWFYVNALVGLEQVAKPARIHENDILIGDTFAQPRPEAAASAVDPADAGREDLDYRTAERIGTLDGWWAFLAAHSSGAHAESAKTAIDKLSPAPEPAAAADVSARASPEAKVESEAAPPSPPLEAAALPLHELCNDDRDCPGRSRSDPSGDENTRIADQSDPGKPRSQLASLMDSEAAAAVQSPSANVGRDQGSKPRAAALRHTTAVSSRIVSRPRERPCAFRFGCHRTAQTLPPFLLERLGVKPKHSTSAFGRTFADRRPTGSPGR